ncbi:MAG: lysophospholipid acyltransferase family protein [Deltaproteobacteria bacterium]|nr:lysophospholipid acyltransferase family protein [Deltaproteobacteria bacterium]
MTPLVYGGGGLKILTSRHRDGELITRTVRHFGLETVRGSSTRGGIAGIKGLARALLEGYDVAIAPDGPRGPRHKVQSGIIQLARMSDRPIFSFTFSASLRKVLATWDQFLIPLPFSHGVFIWGDPIWVGPTAGKKEMEAKAALLEKILLEITELADRHYRKWR